MKTTASLKYSRLKGNIFCIFKKCNAEEYILKQGENIQNSTKIHAVKKKF